jgi:glycosyltransferase involved in cell wall biosynthesis
MNNSKVSAVMCTYRRFKCVERATNCFLAQDYPEKELIIFNTDIEHPYAQDEEMDKLGVKIYNCDKDYLTGLSYTNVGAIRRDALTHATGDYYICWDDDDIFLPFFMKQGIDRMAQTGLPSFKPERSFYYGGELCLVRNTLEASIISDINLIRKYGFLLETGKEGLGWYIKMIDSKELDQDDTYSIPHYCFNWHDGQAMEAGHKQSGDINNPENFENHKVASNNIVDGRIKIWEKQRLDELYSIYYSHLRNQSSLPQDLIEKYLPK